jgi:peptidoglycan/xylan/chitin deacetylase (PgdA/CDA1 family)
VFAHVKAVIRTIAGAAYGALPNALSHLRGKVLILMYHRVIPRTELKPTFVQPGMYVTPETFEKHLRFLTNRFQIVTFEETLRKWHDHDWDARTRHCVITFDDGWIDNYLYAYPLLRGYKAPATIFLPTDLIGSMRWLWWDRLGYLLRQAGGRSPASPDELDSVIERAKHMPHVAREAFIDDMARMLGVRFPEIRRFINWDEAREMSASSLITFGSHSATHAMLTRLDASTLDGELRRPLETLRAERVNHVPVLCYPNGNHSSFVIRSARAAGYTAGVTTAPGAERQFPDDLFRLRRVGIHNDVAQSVPSLTFHIARQTWAS